MSATRIWSLLLMAFLSAPLVIIFGSAVSRTGYMSFPPSSFTLRWILEFLTSAEWLGVLGISLVLAILAALASTIASVGAGLYVTRRLRWGKGAVELAILLPLIFPHAALAVAIFSVVRELNLIGTFAGILIAHVIVTLPFAYRPISTSLSKLDPSIEEAAMSLRAPPWTTFRKVTLPRLRPGIVTAMLFSTIISFDELSVTMFLVGPNFTTLPAKIFSEVQDNASPLVAAVASFLVIATAMVILVVKKFFGLQFFVDPEH